MNIYGHCNLLFRVSIFALSLSMAINANADILSRTQLEKPETENRGTAISLGSSSNDQIMGSLLKPENIVNPAAFGDSYSLAPWLADDQDQYYYASALGAPTSHTFDGTDESGGLNSYGSVGGSFSVSEGIIDLGGGVERYVVEVSAVDSSLNNEPWVDAAFEGQVFTAWILEVGNFFGGGNTITPGYSFAVQASGVVVFDSAGTPHEDLGISDTSNSTELSGSAGLTIGADIAGVDVSTIQMYWEIAPTSVDADLDLQSVDAIDGVYAPGDTIDIYNYTENIGGTASTAYTISYYASTDTTITAGDISLGAEPPRGPLDPGAYDYYLTTAEPARQPGKRRLLHRRHTDGCGCGRQQ